MKYFKKIEGEKIYLSPMNEEDYEIYTKWMNDFKVTDGIGNSTLVASLHSEKEWLANNTKGDTIQFAIIDKSNDILLGNCDIHNINYLRQIGELGIFIGEENKRGKGLGTEAVKLLIKYGFEYLNLNNIMLKVYSFNKGAIKAYKKAGFKEIGTRHQVLKIKNNLYDEIYMEILRKDYFKDN